MENLIIEDIKELEKDNRRGFDLVKDLEDEIFKKEKEIVEIRNRIESQLNMMNHRNRVINIYSDIVKTLRKPTQPAEEPPKIEGE